MKRILFAAMMLLGSFSCFAQEQEAPEDLLGPRALQKNHNELSGLDAPNGGFGIKGGVNFANVYGSDAIDPKMLTSFHAGIYAQFALSTSFSLQTEALYSRKGYELDDVKNRFDYLEVPLLAVYNFTENLSIHLGPQIGIMMSAKQDDQEMSLEDMNTFEYGIAAGAEARFSMLRVGTRYNLGLAELRDKNDPGPAVDREIKNGVFQLYLGIGF